MWDNLPTHLKIKWAKEFLSPGLRRLTRRVFISKEWVKFFNWAQEDKYNLIIKYIKLK